MTQATTRYENPRESYIDQLEHELKEKERKIEALEEGNGHRKTKDKVGRGGTPNRSGDVTRLLTAGPPSPAVFRQMDTADLLLNRVMDDGPDVLTVGPNPVCPVHERARTILLNAPSLAHERSKDRSTVFITLPTAKRYLESIEGAGLKHTQVRRAFETIVDAGSEYPRPPVLHKNGDGIIELVVFDYPRLYDTTVTEKGR